MSTVHLGQKIFKGKLITLCGEQLSPTNKNAKGVKKFSATYLTFEKVNCIKCLNVLIIKKNDELARMCRHLSFISEKKESII